MYVLPQKWGTPRQQRFQMLWWDLNREQIPQTRGKFHPWAAAQISSLISRLWTAGSISWVNTGVHRHDSWVYPGRGWALHPEALQGWVLWAFTPEPLQKARCWFLPEPAALHKNDGFVLNPNKARISSNVLPPSTFPQSCEEISYFLEPSNYQSFKLYLPDLKGE